MWTQLFPKGAGYIYQHNLGVFICIQFYQCDYEAEEADSEGEAFMCTLQ